MPPPETVTILGAGVSGLTCGVLFAERGSRTRILAEEFGAHTTSGAAAAIWFPYDAEPLDQVIAWALQTLEVLRELSSQSSSGVSMIELRSLARAGEAQIPDWAHSLDASRLLRAEIPPGFTSGFRLEVPLMDTTRYLDYLATRLRKAGGEIQIGARFQQLDEVRTDGGLLINCTGFGAGTLVPDPELEPHRGQVVLVPKTPQPCAVVCNEEPLMYAIPRAGDCVFGGTNDVSAERDPDPEASARIIAECSRVLQIEPPRVLGERVGLRPFRPTGVCLRADQLRDGRRVIHNYGHGGSGFTLSWGCAHAVLKLAMAERAVS